MYAIIATGGKQYKVTEGDIITVEKLNVEAGQEVTFNTVLVLSKNDTVSVGAPYVEGASVVASVLGTGADLQNVDLQREKLRDAGVYVCQSNRQAAQLAAEIIRQKKERDG